MPKSTFRTEHSKSDDRLTCSISRHLFIDEDVGNKKAGLNIDIAIRSNCQVFNKIFRAKLSLPEQGFLRVYK